MKKAREPRPLIPALREEGDAGGVGGAFLDAAEGEELAHRRLLPGLHDAGAGVARSRRHRRGAEQQREEHDAGRDLGAFPHADDVAAGNVAKLVGDDALDLVAVVGRREQAGVDVDHLPAGHEGVDRIVVEQDDRDVFGPQPRRGDDRPGDVAEPGLGLGVAQDFLRHGGAHGDREAQGQDEEEPRGEGAEAANASRCVSHACLRGGGALNRT